MPLFIAAPFYVDGESEQSLNLNAKLRRFVQHGAVEHRIRNFRPGYQTPFNKG